MTVDNVGGDSPTIQVVQNWYEEFRTASRIKSPETNYIALVRRYLLRYPDRTLLRPLERAGMSLEESRTAEGQRRGRKESVCS